MEIIKLQERYDELDNIISTLDCLIDSITDKDYIDELRETKYRAEEERDEIDSKLQKLYDEEEKEMNYQFEKDRL